MNRFLFIAGLWVTALLPLDAQAFCGWAVDCEARYCRTHQAAFCPGSGWHCISCAMQPEPCHGIGSAIPWGSSYCAFCGGPCHVVMASLPEHPTGGAPRSPEETALSVRPSSARVKFDLLFEPNLQDLQPLIEYAPSHAALLLQFEAVSNIDPLPRLTRLKTFMHSEGVEQALIERKEAGESLLLRQSPIADRMGPFDLLVDVEVLPHASGQIQLLISSWHLVAFGEELELEAQSVIKAALMEPTGSRYLIQSISLIDDTSENW